MSSDFLDYISGKVGTDKWCVAARLTQRLRSEGYEMAINPMRYHKLCTGSPFPLIRFCDVLRARREEIRDIEIAKRATPERPFIATGSSELAKAERLVRAGLLQGQGDGLLDGCSQTFVGVK